MVQCLRRKRKGYGSFVRSDILEVLPIGHNSSPSFLAESHLSLVEHSRLRKKCKEHPPTEVCSARATKSSRFITALICRTSANCASYPPGRGLKRKLGCIDSATQMGRKKKLEQDYILGPEIGQGKFGSVRLCWSKASGEEFACKTLLKNGEETVHREVEIMQHLSGHPGVVTLKAVYEDVESFHLVMELCPGGRLLDWMVKHCCYSERQAAILLKELVLVIKYCHEMGVVHRDIKPENILLTVSGKIKLADFGLAVRVSNGQVLSGVAGSPAYVAPEVLLGDYSEKVDIWGAGVLLHALLVGFLPFQGSSLEAIFESIKTVKLEFQHGVWGAISSSARDLLGRMLTRDVNTRISAEEVLCHPWILFYTEDSLKPLSFKSEIRDQGKTLVGSVSLSKPISFDPKIRNRGQCHQQLETSDAVERRRCGIYGSSAEAIDASDEVYPSETDNQRVEEQDCGLVDALAVAISRVRISEPKRTRVCGPFPIQPGCSSNMKSNLCTAF
ncbi:unnamed protein product [Victoria cruziana]